MNIRIKLIIPAYFILSILASSAYAQIDKSLFNAIQNCDTFALQKALKAGANINAADENGANALMWAVYYCDVPVVRLLIKNGGVVPKSAAINIDGEKIFYYGNLQGLAFRRGKLALLAYLIDSIKTSQNDSDYNQDSTRNDDYDALLWAINSGQTGIVDSLLKRVADRAGVNRVNAYNQDTSKKEGYDLLLWAIKFGKTNIVDSLLKREADQVGLNRVKALARSYFDAGVYKTASSLYRKVLDIERKSGVNGDTLARSLYSLADLYVRLNEYDNALPLYQELVQVIKNEYGEDHPEYLIRLNELAVLYEKMGKIDLALSVIEKGLNANKIAADEKHPQYIDILKNIIHLCGLTGEVSKAIPWCEDLVIIMRKYLGEGNYEHIKTLDQLVDFYIKVNDLKKAKFLCRQSLEYKKKFSGDYEYLFELDKLSNLQIATKEFDSAVIYRKEALEVARVAYGEDHQWYGMMLNNLVKLYEKKGDHKSATTLLQHLFSIQQSKLNYSDNNTNSPAAFYISIGQYEKALIILKINAENKRIQSGDESSDYATALNDLAIVYNELGEYNNAFPLYQEVLRIRGEVIRYKNENYAITLNNLASLYFHIGEYQKAVDLYGQSVVLGKKIHANIHLTALNNLASLYFVTGDYKKALTMYRQVLKINKRKNNGEDSRDAVIWNNLGNLYRSMGNQEKAVRFYKKAIAITERTLGGQHPDNANYLYSLAQSYASSGDYKNASSLYDQALDIINKAFGADHPNNVTLLNSMGLVYATKGSFKKASELFIKANKIEIKYLSLIYSTLSEHEKLVFLQQQSPQFSFLPSLMYKCADKGNEVLAQLFANELVLKGMVLEDQLQVFRSIRKNGDSSVLHLFEQWSINKALLGSQFLLPITQRGSSFDSLQEATTELEQQLSRRAEAFRNVQNSKAITVTDVGQKLMKGQAAIEFVRFELSNKEGNSDSILYAALLLLPENSAVTFIPLFEERQLQLLLKNAAVAINSDVSIQQLYRGVTVSGKQPGAASENLYQLIWEPLEKHLDSIQTIFYAPAGLLNRIAFQALRLDSTHLLIDKYQLNQVLSTRSVAIPEEIIKKPVSIASWGNIDYNLSADVPFKSLVTLDSLPVKKIDTSASSFNFYTSRSLRGKIWASLPGTTAEVDSISKLCSNAGVNVTFNNTGSTATEEAFKALDGKSPQVLHLATHGFFLPAEEIKSKEPNLNLEDNSFSVQENPMFRSGLVLAGGNHAWKNEPAIPGREDGILTAYEIAQMDLSNTNLVVLSACETALGDLQGNEGVIGLQRAFKMAGVKQMIMSLWRVPDKETMELMTLFYRNWLSGQTTREALRKAQLAMKVKYPEPYYWAAFVLVE